MRPQKSTLKAKPISDPRIYQRRALAQILRLRRTMRRHNRQDAPKSFLDGAFQLCLLKKDISENLNQFPHEVLVLEAQRQLSERPKYENLEWYWHPRQTSGSFETDLMGWRGEQLVVVAEANTSASPVGTIRDRIVKAVSNLAGVEHPADRFFFCFTESCAAWARKVTSAMYPNTSIEMVVLTSEIPA